MKKIGLIGLLIILGGIGFSERIGLPYVGFLTPSPDPVCVDIDWDEDWFLGSSFEYNHNIARIACYLSAVSYNWYKIHEIPESLKFSLSRMGFPVEKTEFLYNDSFRAQKKIESRASIAITSKKFDSDSNKNLIVVVIRGTPFQVNEWLSNLDVSNSKKKSKFYECIFSATEYVYDEILTYMEKNGLDFSDSCFLITGHSRGASVANQLGAKFAENQSVNTCNIFDYTFGTSNIVDDDNYNDPRYGFIWNIENVEDIVHYVLPDQGNWNYHKYGNILMLQNEWSNSNFSDEFVPRINYFHNLFSERNFHPWRRGPFVPIEIMKTFTNVCGDVNEYNRAFFGVRRIFEKILKTIFSEKKKNSVQKLSEKNITKLIEKSSKKTTKQLFELFLDMHSTETYLSYLLALDESEAYTESKYWLIKVSGNVDISIINDNNEVCGNIKNGYSLFNTVHVPVGLISTPCRTDVGFTPGLDYKLLIRSDSIIPNPVSFQYESYDKYGSFEYRKSKQVLYLYPEKKIYFSTENILEKQRFEFLSYDDEKDFVREGSDIPFSWKNNFSLGPEFSVNFNGNPELGIVFGNRLFFGKLLYSFNFLDDKFLKSSSFVFGAGNQLNIFWRFYMEQDILARMVFAYNNEISFSDVNMIPVLRFSFGYKPFNEFELFFASEFNFNISGFNNPVFCGGNNLADLGSFNITDYIEVFPDLRMGLKFYINTKNKKKKFNS